MLAAGSPRSASRSNGTYPTASGTASIRTDCATAVSFSPAAWRRCADAAIRACTRSPAQRRMMNAETFALIVGGGPVGLAAAIELHWRAVPIMLVTDKLETARHPKCNNTNARSMEHFRRLGIADELRSQGLPPH